MTTIRTFLADLEDRKVPDARKLAASLSEHAEDIALGLGTLLTGVGVALAYGYAFGLITVGVLVLAAGVWITVRRT